MRWPWTERRSEGFFSRLLLLPLVVPSWFWAAGAALHRALYRKEWIRRRRLSCAVVSVGGLAVGGSGKTPLAALVARMLRARGHRVVIASRGYGRRGTGTIVVSDGRHVRSTPHLAGDEPMLLAAHAPDVPVIVARDRGLAGLRAVSVFGAEVVVLDDGFQHHRLARDVDIVALDGATGLGDGWVLPRGPLREPRSALREADVVVVVDGPLEESEEGQIGRSCPHAVRVEGRRMPIGWRPLAGGPLRPVAELSGLRVGLLAGIARPSSLRRSVESLGARVVAERLFADHHRWSPRDVRDLDPVAEAWITTEKDAVKLVAGWAGDADVRVLVIEIAIEREAQLASWLEQRLRGVRQR